MIGACLVVYEYPWLVLGVWAAGTLKENPDTLQSFLTLYMRIITFCPQHIFSKDGAVVAVYELGEVCGW